MHVPPVCALLTVLTESVNTVLRPLVTDPLRRHPARHRTDRHKRRSERGNRALVVSFLVSSVYVRLRSSVFKSMRRCRSRTLTVSGELLSQLLKIGRSAVKRLNGTGDHLAHFSVLSSEVGPCGVGWWWGGASGRARRRVDGLSTDLGRGFGSGGAAGAPRAAG
jgi:hypothetical protein